MSDEVVYPGGFRPGDEVEVGDGTFVGSVGTVVTPGEWRVMRQHSGAGAFLYEVEPGCVWVALPVLGRTVPVMLLPFQIQDVERR